MLVKLLFICSQNKNRSRTAEDLFRGKYETRSAGLYNEHPVTAKELEWADTICVMEEEQRHELGKRFPGLYLKKRILCLDIPDVYIYNDPELVEQLERKVNAALEEKK
ncbi:MAG: phosphotyrosine protein phosphatase [Nanoarchaeota archaeon]